MLEVLWACHDEVHGRSVGICETMAKFACTQPRLPLGSFHTAETAQREQCWVIEQTLRRHHANSPCVGHEVVRVLKMPDIAVCQHGDADCLPHRLQAGTRSTRVLWCVSRKHAGRQACALGTRENAGGKVHVRR